MIKKTLTIAGIFIIMISAYIAFFSQSPFPAEKKFTPPVYGKYGNEKFIALPLYLQMKGELTEEQRERVAEFRAHILKRSSSRIPLDPNERNIIRESISTSTEKIEGMTVVNQNLLKWSEAELEIINKALIKGSE